MSIIFWPIPIAAGVLYPKFGITLRPEFSAFSMSLHLFIEAVNAVLLKRVEREKSDCRPILASSNLNTVSYTLTETMTIPKVYIKACTADRAKS